MREETNASLHTSDHYGCPTLHFYKTTNSTKLSNTKINKNPVSRFRAYACGRTNREREK